MPGGWPLQKPFASLVILWGANALPFIKHMHAWVYRYNIAVLLIAMLAIQCVLFATTIPATAHNSNAIEAYKARFWLATFNLLN